MTPATPNDAAVVQEQLEAEARGFVANTLLGTVLREIKLLERPWVSLTAKQQQDVIDRLGACVDEQVRQAVRLIATAKYPRIAADVEQVTIKDGLKITLVASKFDAARHELVDAQGKSALIVLADPREFMQGQRAKAEADQKPLAGV